MHITSLPASSEMLDVSNLYGDSGDQCGYFSLDESVPESSHTVEIEYVYEQEYEESNLETTSVQTKKSKKQTKVEEPETDLTNLTWLQNITNIMAMPEFPIPPMSPNPQVKTPPNSRLQKFNQTIAKCQQDFMENKEEYQRNSEKKPTYSYSTLICMAMRYNNDKMTLSAIYSWIRDNFKYYRNADPTWQNSIRHNLSLNKVFVKVARSKHEPGKGGFWKLDLAHLEGSKRISNRPHKKKKETKAEEKIAIANIPQMECVNMDEVAQVSLHLPEFNLPLPDIEANVGANVIVEPVPLIQEDDLSSLLLNPTDWEDLQLDMLDNYLDSCFK